MSLLFYDGFDHYTTIADKGWTTAGTAIAPAITAAEGRTDACLKWSLAANESANPVTITPTRASSTASGVCGMALKVTGLSNINGGRDIFFAPNQSGEAGIQLFLNSDGTFSLGRSDLAVVTILATSSGGIVNDVWAYVEFKWLIANSGTFEIWIDGTQVMTFSGDTLSSYTTLATWESVSLLSVIDAYSNARNNFQCVITGGATIVVRVDDFYLLDLAGSYNTDRLGDCTVEALLPQTDAVDAGTNAGWTCSTGSDHGALVDEADPDDDTTYVYASTNVKDTWNYPSLSVANATIYGVQVSTCAKKAEPGTAEFKNLARVTTTDNQGTTTHSPADTGYVYYRDIWEVNPDDSSVWTVADVNDAEFGVERTA